MTEKFRVAHYFAFPAGALLAAHPLVSEVRSIDRAQRWDLPIDVDVIFAPPDFGDVDTTTAPRPDGWPGAVRFVQLASSGTDGYPHWLFDGPVVATAAGTSAVPIAEFVLTAMLMHAKRLPAMQVSDGTPWLSQTDLLANPLASLNGATLGLLGIGHIGQRIAHLASAFGMRVVAHRRSDAPSPSPEVTLVTFDALMASADHLVIAAPLSPATAGLIDASALARTRRGVHLVNIARGAIIDATALAAALVSGHVGGASLDVTDPEPLPPGHPLWAAPNLRITPHMAWSAAATPQRIFARFADNLTRFAAGQAVVSQVG